jgi:hypothetical protein
VVAKLAEMMREPHRVSPSHVAVADETLGSV